MSFQISDDEIWTASNRTREHDSLVKDSNSMNIDMTRK